MRRTSDRIRAIATMVNAELDPKRRTPVHRDPPTRPWATSPAGAVILTIGGILAAILLGSLPAVAYRALVAEPEWVVLTLRGVGVTAAAILILYRVRHTLARQTTAGLGLSTRWTAPLEGAAGVAVGVGVVLAADWLAVSAGVVDWRPADDLGAELAVSVLIAALLVPLIQEAVPEELWFRGHLYDTLSRSLPPAKAILLTATVFGALHILSEPPEGIAERLLYVVMATGFGLLLTAGRAVTGALWLPIGLHAGHNAFMHRLVDVDEGSYAAVLLARAGVMAIVALALLAIAHWRQRRFGADLPT